MWDPMSAQHSKSGSALLELDRGPLAQPPYTAPTQLPAGSQNSLRSWKKRLHMCGHIHVDAHTYIHKCLPVPGRVFMPLFSPSFPLLLVSLV